jgi:hypothetical protein
MMQARCRFVLQMQTWNRLRLLPYEQPVNRACYVSAALPRSGLMRKRFCVLPCIFMFPAHRPTGRHPARGIRRTVCCPQWNLRGTQWPSCFLLQSSASAP